MKIKYTLEYPVAGPRTVYTICIALYRGFRTSMTQATCVNATFQVAKIQLSSSMARLFRRVWLPVYQILSYLFHPLHLQPKTTSATNHSLSWTRKRKSSSSKTRRTLQNRILNRIKVSSQSGLIFRHTIHDCTNWSFRVYLRHRFRRIKRLLDPTVNLCYNREP